MIRIQLFIVLKLAVAALFFLTPLNTVAGVFKCTNSDGAVTYQSSPCSVESTETRIKIEKHSLGNAPSSTQQATTPTVILYSTTWCGYCKKVRKLFSDNNIVYKELDIETSANAKRAYDKLGGKGVPLTTVDGTVVRGFQPQRLLDLAAPDR